MYSLGESVLDLLYSSAEVQVRPEDPTAWHKLIHSEQEVKLRVSGGVCACVCVCMSVRVCMCGCMHQCKGSSFSNSGQCMCNGIRDSLEFRVGFLPLETARPLPPQVSQIVAVVQACGAGTLACLRAIVAIRDLIGDIDITASLLTLAGSYITLGREPRETGGSFREHR